MHMEGTRFSFWGPANPHCKLRRAMVTTALRKSLTQRQLNSMIPCYQSGKLFFSLVPLPVFLHLPWEGLPHQHQLRNRSISDPCATTHILYLQTPSAILVLVLSIIHRLVGLILHLSCFIACICLTYLILANLFFSIHSDDFCKQIRTSCKSYPSVAKELPPKCKERRQTE